MHIQDKHFRAYELPTFEILIYVPFCPVPEDYVWIQGWLQKLSYQENFRALHWRYVVDIGEKKKKKVDWQSKWVYYFFLKKDVVIIIDFTSLLSKKYRMYAKLKSDIHIRSNVLAVRNLSNCKRSEPGKEPKKGRPKLKNPAFYRNLSRNIWINVFKKEEKMLLIVL